MPRLPGRCPSVRSLLCAADRLRDIESEIREILRTYPDISATPSSNVHSTDRPRRQMPFGRMWTLRRRSDF